MLWKIMIATRLQPTQFACTDRHHTTPCRQVGAKLAFTFGGVDWSSRSVLRNADR